jgi:hypothetical protein
VLNRTQPLDRLLRPEPKGLGNVQELHEVHAALPALQAGDEGLRAQQNRTKLHRER